MTQHHIQNSHAPTTTFTGAVSGGGLSVLAKKIGILCDMSNRYGFNSIFAKTKMERTINGKLEHALNKKIISLCEQIYEKNS